jgi:hypothetical protein
MDRFWRAHSSPVAFCFTEAGSPRSPVFADDALVLETTSDDTRLDGNLPGVLCL